MLISRFSRFRSRWCWYRAVCQAGVIYSSFRDFVDGDGLWFEGCWFDIVFCHSGLDNKIPNFGISVQAMLPSHFSRFRCDIGVFVDLVEVVRIMRFGWGSRFLLCWCRDFIFAKADDITILLWSQFGWCCYRCFHNYHGYRYSGGDFSSGYVDFATLVQVLLLLFNLYDFAVFLMLILDDIQCTWF